jgi:hypothetical protein
LKLTVQNHRSIQQGIKLPINTVASQITL